MQVRESPRRVQAGVLVNGAGIMRDVAVPEVFTYYHVETPGHELILAEGAVAETFIDNVSRMGVDNGDEREAPAEIVEMAYPADKIRPAAALGVAPAAGCRG